MANAEWERLKEALRKAPTPSARKEASAAMKRYLETRRGRGSRPTLVSLGLRKTYPHAIPLDKIPEELEKNPEFFELFGRIVK